MTDLILKVYFSTLEAAIEAANDTALGEPINITPAENASWYHVSEENLCHAIEYIRTNRERFQIDDWDTVDNREQLLEA